MISWFNNRKEPALSFIGTELSLLGDLLGAPLVVARTLPRAFSGMGLLRGSRRRSRHQPIYLSVWKRALKQRRIRSRPHQLLAEGPKQPKIRARSRRTRACARHANLLQFRNRWASRRNENVQRRGHGLHQLFDQFAVTYSRDEQAICSRRAIRAQALRRSLEARGFGADRHQVN